ncbi:MAG: UvrD-helicase domain-containing protein [Kiloniellales bacterium]
MLEPEIDLFAIDRGAVTAPAGCGKTHLIAETLARHTGPKPILVLTHTNAGVVALRRRLDGAGVQSKYYRLLTIDGWAMRLIAMFPQRGAYDPKILKLAHPGTDYPNIRIAAVNLLKAKHINDVLAASYSRLIVDEYQDCSIRQHAVVAYAAKTLPTCVLGDPMQAIFGFGSDRLARWDEEVCTYFPVAGELETPWRWINAGKENFGRWLLDVRRKLLDGQAIDLTTAPEEVSWVHLDGTENMVRMMRAAQIAPPTANGRVLIIGRSTSPQSQRAMASRIPGAVTVENVDLRDFVDFARHFDFNAANAFQELAAFAGDIMTNVGLQDLLRRVRSLQQGSARKAPSDTECAALAFCAEPSPTTAANLLVEINKESGVRPHRPAVLRACMKALQQCDGTEGNSFYEASVRIREQNRLVGRPLAKRSVGSTLLLKGLEADVCVILEAHDLDPKNLYVAMTRGAQSLIVCGRTSQLNPT